MPDQPTCGQGLAAHAALPAKLGELIAATADNLEAHMPSLDRSDPAADREHAVYEELTSRHRTLAAQLEATAEAMAAQRELPMGRHDEQALAAPEAVAAFRRLVAVEEQLAKQLDEQLAMHRGMLEGQ
jgi:hypothetical protein